MIDLVKDAGADRTGVLDSSQLLQAAINSGEDVYIPKGTYLLVYPIVIPEGSATRIFGAGIRHTFLNYSGIGSCIKYIRTEYKAGSSVIIEDLNINLSSAHQSQGSVAIEFKGYGVWKDDNWLRVYRCGFTNWEVAVRLKYAGQCYFVDNFYQANVYSLVLERGASFLQFRGCMSFDSTFIHASDPTGDAYSNGIIVESCNNITSTKENIFIEGWQAVFISKCGWDLGSGGTAALWFRKCQDVYLDKCFISSDGVVDRVGVWMEETHTYGITQSSIVNNSVGIRNSANTVNATKGTITDCKFEGNRLNDIVLFEYTEAVKITGCHFQTLHPRIGTNFEIFGNFPGVNNCVVMGNTFRGAAFTLPIGPNSVVFGNISNTKA